MAMRQFHRIAHWLLAFGPLALCFLAPSVPAQTNGPTEDANSAVEDKEGCIRNLKVIYQAIQLYQMDHKDIPNWLSDLVPQYLDANALICPACKRTGQIESSALADPKLPCSYLYEFCPVPLGKTDAPGDPTKTRRDWKRRQMGLVGAVVPIVRCRHHGEVLNLSFDGRVYESPASWEDLLTNRVDITELQSARIFATAQNNGESSTSAAGQTASGESPYPPRDPNADPRLIDLSKYYNAVLTDSWHGKPGNDLSTLPSGLQKFAGVEYDVRGIIQLSSKSLSRKSFPQRVNGIKIGRKCAQLHFLHAVGYVTKEGELVGSYIVHFGVNHMQLEIPIFYGRDVRDWHKYKEEDPSPTLTVAWTGSNPVSNTIRLYTTTWTNIVPDVEIESIDFVSAMGNSAPFLIALTAE
jgi:hypothetical protein